MATTRDEDTSSRLARGYVACYPVGNGDNRQIRRTGWTGDGTNVVGLLPHTYMYMWMVSDMTRSPTAMSPEEDDNVISDDLRAFAWAKIGPGVAEVEADKGAGRKGATSKSLVQAQTRKVYV
jgi:hypothetical protein